MTATKKRTKSDQKAEAEAQALRKFDVADGDDVIETTEVDAFNGEHEETIPYTLPNETSLENQLAAESEADEAAADEHRKAQAFEQIATLNTEASKAFDAWKRADEIAKGKKKGYEAAVNELRGY